MSRSSLSDFEVLLKLGSGSFGTVYKVRRLADNKPYVIKNVRIIDLSRREQAEAINEVQILAQLDSVYVVKYYDSFIEKDCLFIVMEFCNRGDLQNLLKKAKERKVTCLKESVIWNIVLQVILGLHYIHKKKILHRDLKTANVFLTKDHNNVNYLVKIGDLGVAKLLDTSTALASTIVGTPYYLSPELCADKPYRDKSDCWALGVMLYECCTLEHPFEARNQCALIMKIIQSPVKPPPSTSVSAEMINLVLWLLQKDPNNRPSIKDLLNEATIRQKLKENNFELPQELKESGQFETTYLNVSGDLNTTLKFNEAGEIVNFTSPETINGTTSRDRDRVEAETPVVAYEKERRPPPMISQGGRKASSGEIVISNNNNINTANNNILVTKSAPSVRGDRVRGGAAKRVQSDKALTRYQVRSSANAGSGQQSAAGVANDSGSEYEGDWVADEKPSTGAGENKAVGGGGAAKGIADRAAKDADEETYEQEGFEVYEEKELDHDVDSKKGSVETYDRDRPTKYEYDGSSPADYDELVGTEHDHHHQVVDAKIEADALEAAGGIEMTSATSVDFQSLLEGIQEAKQQAISTLGEHVFMKVYELCAKSMIQGDGAEKSTSFLEELEKTLNENTACTDMGNACEAVFKVKVLLALESKYDSIIVSNTLNSSANSSGGKK
eukprot:gene22734-31020_t